MDETLRQIVGFVTMIATAWVCVRMYNHGVGDTISTIFVGLARAAYVIFLIAIFLGTIYGLVRFLKWAWV